MKSRIMPAALLFALMQTVPGNSASTQGAASGGAGLNTEQREGYLLALQYCGLCHTRTNLHSTTTIGPILSRDSGGGRDDVVRQVIADGTPNMPGFKYLLEPAQIAAIAAYLKTVPPQAATPVKH
jgi:mono/diheme cytochrome c family protein